MTVFENSGYRKYNRMKRALTNEMFKKFSKAPLTTLIWIEQNGKIPTQTDFDTILKDYYVELSYDSEISSEGNINYRNN